MGKGGPQPAHQVRPGDLQVEEAVLDLEDSEIFGHIIVPVGQLMSNYDVSSVEKSIGEVLDDDDDDEDDEYEPKDVDTETIEEHESVCEGPSNGVIYNLNNNAKKSRKSTRKGMSSVLHQVDMLLQEIIYRDRESKRQPVEEENERLWNNDESMNKTHNNRYLRSIQEEDTVSKEETNGNCQQKDGKNNNKADPNAPATEPGHGAAPKRRFHGCRRQAHGLWGGQGYDRPSPAIQFPQVNMCGDGSCDYGELRKGMGDVVDEASALNNLAIMSDNDKVEVNHEDRESQSPDKLPVGPSTLEEMDHTTAADFSSFLEPGCVSLNATDASQTTLIDEATLSADLSSQQDQEETAIPEEVDITCQTGQDIAPPPGPRGVRFRERLNTDTSNAKFKDQKQSATSPGKRVSEFPRTVEDTSSVQQNKSSDERAIKELPNCQIKVMGYVSPGPILASLASSRVSKGANSTISKQCCTAQITSKPQMGSLVKEYQCNNCPGREIPTTSLNNSSSENVTQNHSSSQPLEGSSKTLESPVNCGQGKYSKRSSRKRRKLRRMLQSSTVEVEKSHTTGPDKDMWKDRVSHQSTQEAADTGTCGMINDSEQETNTPGGVQSPTAQVRSCKAQSTTFTVHDNAKANTFSVHDNAKANTFSVHSYSEPDNFSVHVDAKPGTLTLHDTAKPTTFSVLDNITYSTLHVHDNAKPNALSVYDNAKPNILSVHDNAKLNALSVYHSAKPNALSVHDNAKASALYVHDNAKHNTFSIQCQTSHQDLTPTSVQCQISQSKASAENRAAGATDVSNFTAMDTHKTASNRVLNKLLTSKRSQAQRKSTASIFYNNKDVQTNITAVHRKKRLSSHQMSPLSVRLPQITKLISASTNPYKDEMAREYDNIKVTRLTMRPGMYDSVQKDVFYHLNNKITSNLARDMSSRFSVSTSVVSKTHISIQKHARASLLLHSSMHSATQSSIVNANLNSTSSYPTTRQQDQDEVTVRISSDTTTDSRNTSASSRAKKKPPTSTNTTTQERNRGVFSYFGNRFFKSSVQNCDSSVDGEEYPIKKKIVTSSARDQASQTHEDQIISAISVRKDKCHHVRTISDCRQGLVEEQGTQTYDMRNNMNTLSAPGNLSNRYNVEMLPAGTSRGRKGVLPRLEVQRHQEEQKQAQENPINVRSSSTKDYSCPQSDSFNGRQLAEDENFQVDVEGQWYTKIPRHQDTKRVHAQGYAQQGWEVKDTSITARRNLENAQRLPPLGPENFNKDGTTYRVSFQDPKIHTRSSNMLYPSPYDQERARIRQKNASLESYHERDEAQYFGADWHQGRSSDNQTPYRAVFPSHTFEYAWQNKLRDQDSNVVFESDKMRKSVSFDNSQLRPMMKPMSDESDLSSKFRRSKTLPSTTTYPDVNSVPQYHMAGSQPHHCPDRWDLHYKDFSYPATMIEKRRVSEPRLLPARLLADSYYDPSSNVINVVVKPINVNLNKKLQNIRVKIYRSPPRLPRLCPCKERTRKKKYSSAPLPRNIINGRAANPPFNTATSQEANERYHSMYDNWKIL